MHPGVTKPIQLHSMICLNIFQNICVTKQATYLHFVILAGIKPTLLVAFLVSFWLE